MLMHICAFFPSCLQLFPSYLPMKCSAPSCVCYLDNGVVFIGSAHGDSQLLKVRMCYVCGRLRSLVLPMHVPHPTDTYTPNLCDLVMASIAIRTLMSIVLNVHPGVQLYTRVDSKKSFCRSSRKGPSGI